MGPQHSCRLTSTIDCTKSNILKQWRNSNRILDKLPQKSSFSPIDQEEIVREGKDFRFPEDFWKATVKKVEKMGKDFQQGSLLQPNHDKTRQLELTEEYQKAISKVLPQKKDQAQIDRENKLKQSTLRDFRQARRTREPLQELQENIITDNFVDETHKISNEFQPCNFTPVCQPTPNHKKTTPPGQKSTFQTYFDLQHKSPEERNSPEDKQSPELLNLRIEETEKNSTKKF